MSKKKVSQEELAQVISNFSTEVSNVLQILGSDVMKIQKILYNHLDEEGKIERIICKSCGQELLRPDIKGVEKSDICPSCGNNIFEGEQTTFENWDNGTTTEEE